MIAVDVRAATGVGVTLSAPSAEVSVVLLGTGAVITGGFGLGPFGVGPFGG